MIESSALPAASAAAATSLPVPAVRRTRPRARKRRAATRRSAARRARARSARVPRPRARAAVRHLRAGGGTCSMPPSDEIASVVGLRARRPRWRSRRRATPAPCRRGKARSARRKAHPAAAELGGARRVGKSRAEAERQPTLRQLVEGRDRVRGKQRMSERPVRAAVPRVTRSVTPATAARTTSGSSRGRAVSESLAQSDANPSVSTLRAEREDSAASVRPARNISRVGSRIPASTPARVRREVAFSNDRFQQSQ